MDNTPPPPCPRCGYTLLAEGGRHLASGTTACPVDKTGREPAA